jgi:hypothetical protein
MKKTFTGWLDLIKTCFIVFCIFFLSFTSFVVAKSVNSSNQLVMTYSFESPMINQIQIEDMIYDEVMLSEVFIVGEPGEPCLPLKGCYILLPPGCVVESIQVNVQEKKVLGNDYVIKPAGEIVPLFQSGNVSLPSADYFIYSSDDTFPGKLYEVGGVYSFRGYSILVLGLFPVQYKPLSGELFYYPEMKVSVTVNSVGTINSFYRGAMNDQQAVSSKVDNPEIMSLYPKTLFNPTDEADLLILTTEQLKSGFEPLKNAHNYRGIQTVIKTLSDVGSSDPKDIRDFIRDAYTDWGIEYVLIGGDDTVVPARMLWVLGMDEGSTAYETYMPSDLYYACLDGPYNYNGNDKWGEPNDGENGDDVDLIAEVYIGRACVDTLSDVSNFVSKTISYIVQDPEDEYFKKVILAGEYLGNYGVASWGGNYLDQLINGCDDDGYTTVGVPSSNYTITTLYDRDWAGNNWPKSEIKNNINSNIHIINHLGHASYGYNLKLDNSDVYDLNNDKYCFIYSQGCMAGGFDNPNGYDCIAEHLTAKTPHAAVAVIMNARYGWFWSYSTDGDSQRFNRAFWDAVFGQQIPEISKANQQSKEDNLPIITRSCIRWCYYQLNLFGDPTISFYNNPLSYPAFEIKDIDGGLGIQSTLINTGEADATTITYSITVTGGLFNLVNKTIQENISFLPVNEEIIINTDFFFGLGPVTITISVVCDEGIFVEKIVQAKQLFIYTKIE